MKSRYIPLTQQPYCCVPTTIQMILLRKNLPLLSQENIGYDLGLTVPEEYYEILPNARRGEKPISGWGTQIGKKEFSLNSFFEKNNYPLRYEYYFPKSINGDLKGWIQQQIQLNNDVIACFNYKDLYQTGNDGGHVCLIDQIEDENVILVEPERNFPKFRRVNFDDLIKSMISHGEERSGGFWLIKEK